MSDDALREIQLGGKQLVFLFMVVTVAAVVVFLLGVMVGRDLRPPLAAGVTGAALLGDSDPTTSLVRPRVTGSTSTSSGMPLSARETLTYAGRLESPGAPPEALTEPIPLIEHPPLSTPPEPVPEPNPSSGRLMDLRAANPNPEPARPAPRAAAALSSEPPGEGFVVQVAAYRQRAEADSVARRLAARGYPSFVTTVTSGGTGSQAFYRVRVGTYGSLREAEAVARRLEKEEQFRPWIDR